jgi:transcriptional regulator with XRE-family HTH domain
VTAGSRRELGEFLRSRRKRITPAQAGLPAGARRRTTGLRREEVAILAGLSPTWYAYLEQGRAIHPSSSVLESLARVLRLSDDERRYMFILAYGHVRPWPLVGDVPAIDLVRRLVDATEDSPYPVYGADLYGDLLAWNRAATVYYTDFALLPPDRRNMIRWLLTSPEAKQRLPQWTDDARDIVARWRAATAPHRDDPWLREQVAELRRISPEFGPWWDEHDVQELRTRIRHFRHPDGREEAMRLIVVQAAEFAPCLVAFHVPTTDADRQGQ